MLRMENIEMKFEIPSLKKLNVKCDNTISQQFQLRIERRKTEAKTEEESLIRWGIGGVFLSCDVQA